VAVMLYLFGSANNYHKFHIFLAASSVQMQHEFLQAGCFLELRLAVTINHIRIMGLAHPAVPNGLLTK